MNNLQEAPVTLIILAATILISLKALNNGQLYYGWMFNPVSISSQRQYYRFFSNGFIHKDHIHLIFNMVSLFYFGPPVEIYFKLIFNNLNGTLLYAIMYAAALPACLLPSYFKHRNNSYYNSLGASGAVSAVVFAFVLLRPTVPLGMFFLPPIIPGFVFGPLYLLGSVWMEKRGGDHINHSAHIWGAIFGIVFLTVMAYTIAGYNILDGFVTQIKWELR